MLLGIVERMAPLAERGEVVRAVVARVMVEMRAGQDHTCDRKTRGRGHAYKAGLFRLKRKGPWQLAHPLATTIAPSVSLGIPSCAVAQVRDILPVWAATVLTAALGTREADHLGQLAPVDRVKPAVLRSDRHGLSLSHDLGRGNPYVRLRIRPSLAHRRYIQAKS